MTDDHLSLDELAELDEGLTPPGRISAIRAHLHGCEQCQARAEAITSTRSMLTDLPDVTMPDEVRARLDRVIAAESGSRTPVSGEATPEPGHAVPEPVAAESPIELSSRTSTVTPRAGTVSRPRFGRPTMAASAAAAAVVLAGGAIIYGHVHHANHNGAATDASNAPANPVHGAIQLPPGSVISAVQPRDFTTSSTGRDYSAANLSGNVLGLITRVPAGSTQTPAPQAPGGGSGDTAAGGARASGGTAAGKKVDHKSVPPAPTTNAGISSPLSTDSLASQPVPHKLRPLYRSHSLQLACAARVSDTPNAVPLAIDFGRWTDATHHNVPSVIFVFKGLDPGKLAVFSVSPTCQGSGLLYNYSQVDAPG